MQGGGRRGGGGLVVAENGSFPPWGFLLRRSSTSPGLHHFIPPPVKRDAYIKPHSEMENGASSDGRDPSGFLSEIIGAPVTVKLNSGVVYKGWPTALLSSKFAQFKVTLGELQSVDGYMNIALEKTEEYVNGKLRRSYGDAFVRGNNGMWMCSHLVVEHTAYSLESYVHILGLIAKLVCRWST